MKAVFYVILFLLTVSMVFCFMPGQGEDGGFFSPIRGAYGEESWKKEFEAICGNTEDAMKLTQDELKNLITRCDRLKPAIESLEETPRKVYLKRLQMCRNLLAFVSEAREKK
jgi:hypothetical protein